MPPAGHLRLGVNGVGRLKRARRSKYQLVDGFQYVTLLFPALIFFTAGMILPMLLGFVFSMTDWNGLSPTMNFIRFANYLRAFGDRRALGAFRFTVAFVVFNTLIQNVGALCFAIALDRGFRGRNVYRTIIFAPALMSPILVGFLWSRIYATILPGINDLIGTSIDFGLLGRPDTVLAGLLIINNWKWIGYWMMIYLAGLQSVPSELYESVAIDGGSEWHKLRFITLPLIMPAITVCIVGIAAGSFKVYDLIVSSTGGGPGTASESIVLYIYNTAFNNYQPAYASAISVLYLALLFVVSFAQLKILRKREVQL